MSALVGGRRPAPTHALATFCPNTFTGSFGLGFGSSQSLPAFGLICTQSAVHAGFGSAPFS
jgi:hypothetical protein